MSVRACSHLISPWSYYKFVNFLHGNCHYASRLPVKFELNMSSLRIFKNFQIIFLEKHTFFTITNTKLQKIISLYISYQFSCSFFYFVDLNCLYLQEKFYSLCVHRFQEFFKCLKTLVANAHFSFYIEFVNLKSLYL
jgi:hypothetical protein